MKEEIKGKDREKFHTSRVKRAEEEKRRKLAKRIAAQQQKMQNGDVGEEITSAMEKNCHKPTPRTMVEVRTTAAPFILSMANHSNVAHI